MVSVPNCKTEGYLKYLFQVRAVNIGTNNATYYGNWSSPGESNCYSSGNDIPVLILEPGFEGEGSGLLQDSDLEWYCGPLKHVYTKQEKKKLYKLAHRLIKYVIND